ncbi:hypothetical protein SAMN05216431_10317 [Ligilactobacillus sp. WC1T17]|uniref:Uncharacterized protein n=1 Tax=Ligilactobacillus ruminis TaxID=1623 RepID=A0ABY1AA12_9LACO|nr:hypothetical protein SAMN05216431_10317 [Ligilactobacillus ruminis]
MQIFETIVAKFLLVMGYLFVISGFAIILIAILARDMQWISGTISVLAGVISILSNNLKRDTKSSNIFAILEIVFLAMLMASHQLI